MIPLFIDNDMHYYRAYVKILTKPNQNQQLGYITYCDKCGSRNVENEIEKVCHDCGVALKIGGPLWIGKLFDKTFVTAMKGEVEKIQVEKRCSGILDKCIEEEGLPPMYYTLDEIASRTKSAPLGLEMAISRLHNSGYEASRTSLNPTGFRTNAKISQIVNILKN